MYIGIIIDRDVQLKYYTVFSILYCVQYTILCSVYYTVFSILYCVQYTILCSVYYTVFSILYCVQYTSSIYNIIITNKNIFEIKEVPCI